MQLVKTLTALVLIAGGAAPILAQEYPARAVRVIAPFSPRWRDRRAGSPREPVSGGALEASDHRGQAARRRRQYRCGNCRAIGTGRMHPAGGRCPHAINITLYGKLPYDLLKDLVAVNRIASYPSAIVDHPSLPVKTVKDLIALPERARAISLSDPRAAARRTALPNEGRIGRRAHALEIQDPSATYTFFCRRVWTQPRTRPISISNWLLNILSIAPQPQSDCKEADTSCGAQPSVRTYFAPDSIYGHLRQIWTA